MTETKSPTVEIPLVPYDKYVLCTGATAQERRTGTGLYLVEDKDLACHRGYVLKSTIEGVNVGDVIFSPKSFTIFIGLEGKALYVVHRDYIVARLPVGTHDNVPHDLTPEVAEIIAANRSAHQQKQSALAAAINGANGRGIIH